mmetsp:Transcript_15454/g.51884  ORF Transcript_15454/g.51884 Transcript_15454/m.51884 type:complete len:317 (-) Transcript_15454:124-1074(-)
MAVLPPSRLGKRHQDRLSAASGLEAKDGSAIVDKVELGVPSASKLLPFLLLGGEGIVLVLLNDGEVGVRHAHNGILAELEDLLRGAVVEVVEEDASEPTSLPSVLDVVVLISPCLELRMEVLVVLVADILEGAMEVLHVLLHEVAGGDILSSSEPPVASLSFEVSVVEVHGWAVGIARVHNRAEPAGKEGDAIAGSIALGTIVVAELEAIIGSIERLERHGAVDDRKVHSSLLPHFSSRHDAGEASSSVLTSPRVLDKLALPIAVLDRLADVSLSISEHLLHLRPHLCVDRNVDSNHPSRDGSWSEVGARDAEAWK